MLASLKEISSSKIKQTILKVKIHLNSVFDCTTRLGNFVRGNAVRSLIVLRFVATFGATVTLFTSSDAPIAVSNANVTMVGKVRVRS